MNSYGRITVHNTSNLSIAKTFTDSSRLYYNWNIDLNSSENAIVVNNYYSWGGRSPVVKYSVSGNNLAYSTTVGTYGSSSTNGNVFYATGVAFDSNDNIYVTDYWQSRIQKFNSSGKYQAKTGSRQYGNPFYYPYGITVDSSDNIYVADYINLSVRKFDTSLTLLESYGGSAGSRLDVAKKVIKKIVSDSNLTSGANFGFMAWASYNQIRVKISNNGARDIYNDIDKVKIGLGYGTNAGGALNAARNYFTSNQVPNWNLTCSNNYLIFISDGYWYGNVNGIANSLNRTHNVKTFAVGFAVSGLSSSQKQNYVDVANLGGTGTPLYADNEAEMIAKLTDAIKQVVSVMASTHYS